MRKRLIATSDQSYCSSKICQQGQYDKIYLNMLRSTDRLTTGQSIQDISDSLLNSLTGH